LIVYQKFVYTKVILCESVRAEYLHVYVQMYRSQPLDTFCYAKNSGRTEGETPA
jgi:hypothetical protein